MGMGRKLSGPGGAVWLRSLLPEPLHYVAWVRGRCLDGEGGTFGAPLGEARLGLSEPLYQFLTGGVCNLRKPPSPLACSQVPGEPDYCPSIPELNFLGLADPGRPTVPPLPNSQPLQAEPQPISLFVLYMGCLIVLPGDSRDHPPRGVIFIAGAASSGGSQDSLERVGARLGGQHCQGSQGPLV